MNTYTRRFTAPCPNNGKTIHYVLAIETDETIMVEDIVKATSDMGDAYHEVIAAKLFALFGGHQVLTAHHHGVDIETRRGFA